MNFVEVGDMSKQEDYVPDVVDFAYQVIEMHKEIMFLRGEVEHLKGIEKIHRDSLANSDKHHKEFLGIILGAALDPDSSINKGHAAMIKEELSETP
jgi:hypothetical protein